MARVIIIHARTPVLDARDPESIIAHCFGPFDNVGAAIAFANESAPDDCFKFALDLVGPAAADAAAAEDLHRTHDHARLT